MDFNDNFLVAIKGKDQIQTVNVDSDRQKRILLQVESGLGWSNVWLRWRLDATSGTGLLGWLAD